MIKEIFEWIIEAYENTYMTKLIKVKLFRKKKRRY